jgi:hypothetical protein
MRISPTPLPQLAVLVLVEPEDHLAAANQDRTPDQVRLRHHQIDRLLLRPRQRTLFEHRAAGADEVEKPFRVDVLLEKRPIRWMTIDVLLVDVEVSLLQKTSGVTAGRSRRFPVEDRLWHADILA